MILIYLIDSGSADIIFHWWPTGAYCRLWLLLPFLPMPPFRVFTFIFLVISIIASSLSDNPFLRHGSFNILTWKFKVKVRHRWCKMSESYYASNIILIHIPFTQCQIDHSFLLCYGYNAIFKFQWQGRGWSKNIYANFSVIWKKNNPAFLSYIWTVDPWQRKLNKQSTKFE